MKRYLIALLIAAQVCTACGASADQNNNPRLDNPVLVILGIELGLALNAEIVASNPNEVGTFMALFGIPYSIALTRNKDDEAAKWVVPLITAAYAAYYINLDEDGKTETEVFQENMLGMHALVAIGIASGYLLDADDKKSDFKRNYSSGEQTTFAGFFPLAGGGELVFMHRF